MVRRVSFTITQRRENIMDIKLQQVKDELKAMYPNLQGFIQHTLVAEMCLSWHQHQLKLLNVRNTSEVSEYLKD